MPSAGKTAGNFFRTERCAMPTYQYLSVGLVLCPGPAEAINTPKGLESFFYLIFQRPKIRMHYVESGQIASLSCWLAAAARTAWGQQATQRTASTGMSGRIPI